MDLLDDIRKQINDRLAELRPLTVEYERLQQVHAALSASGETDDAIKRRGRGPGTASAGARRSAPRGSTRERILAAARDNPDAKLARLAGSAPIPASSGRTDRHRLDHGGNRQLNCALHRLAITKGRLDPETAAYLARRQAEGKTRREAIRCLKRHLARRVWRLLQPVAASDTALGERPPIVAAAGVTLNCSAPFNPYSLT